MMNNSKEYVTKLWTLSIPRDWSCVETRDNVTFKVPDNGKIVVYAMKKQVGFVTNYDLLRYTKPFLDSSWTQKSAEWDELKGVWLESIGKKKRRHFIYQEVLLCLWFYMSMLKNTVLMLQRY